MSTSICAILFIFGTIACVCEAQGAPDTSKTCEPYGRITSGPYTVYANQWGSHFGQGMQCVQIDKLDTKQTSKLDDDVLSWTTNFTWHDNPSQVKSYTNVQSSAITCKPLAGIQTIGTSWKWSASGQNLNGNVAYDLMLGSSCEGSASYEIMIWLGTAGGIGPLSDSGYPPTKVTPVKLGAYNWKLIRGGTDNMKTFSFVAYQPQFNYQGNIMDFINYVKQNEKVEFSNQYVQSLGAGTEVFTGDNGVVKTIAYNVFAT